MDYQDGHPTAAGTGALTCSLQYGGVQASAVTAAAVTVCWLRGMHTYSYRYCCITMYATVDCVCMTT